MGEPQQSAQYSDLPEGAKILGGGTQFSDLPQGAHVLPPKSPEPGLLDRADSAITNFLAPNPDNFRSVARTQKEVPKTLGREVYSGAKAIAGIPGGIYHAFADQPTEEETAEAGGPQEVSGLKRVGLGIGRLTAAPALHAIKDYSSGNVTADNALEVAPEAIGAGAGNVVAGRLVDAAAGPVANAGARTVRAVARGTNKVLEKAPGSVGAAAGASIGHATGIPGAGAAGGIIGGVAGKELLPKVRIPGEGFGFPNRVVGGPKSAPPYEAPPEPIEPEYMNTPPRALSAGKEIPSINATRVGERSQEAAPAPYRKVGGIEKEDVGSPDSSVLAHRGGVIVPKSVSRGLALPAGEPQPIPEASANAEPAAATSAPKPAPKAVVKPASKASPSPRLKGIAGTNMTGPELEQALAKDIAKIKAGGYPPMTEEEPQALPTNPEGEDLTPQLLQSLRIAQARKSASAQPIQ